METPIFYELVRAGTVLLTTAILAATAQYLFKSLSLDWSVVIVAFGLLVVVAASALWLHRVRESLSTIARILLGVGTFLGIIAGSLL